MDGPPRHRSAIRRSHTITTERSCREQIPQWAWIWRRRVQYSHRREGRGRGRAVAGARVRDFLLAVTGLIGLQAWARRIWCGNLGRWARCPDVPLSYASPMCAAVRTMPSMPRLSAKRDAAEHAVRADQDRDQQSALMLHKAREMLTASRPCWSTCCGGTWPSSG